MAWVAVGDDGIRPIVWGVGETEDEALEDAANWLGQAEDLKQLGALTYHEVSQKQGQRVLEGNVAWPIE